MQSRYPPSVILVGALVVALICAALATATALNRPSLGAGLTLRADQIVITQAAATSALADHVGKRLTAIGETADSLVPLIADDLVPEPDILGTPDRLLAFYQRQDRFDTILRGPQVWLEVVGASGPEVIAAAPAPTRQLRDLPLPFWTQIAVGVIGWTLGAWVVAMRPRSGSAWMLLLTGLGLTMAAQSAAVYSTRELALDLGAFGSLSRINVFGTLTFGIGMVTLFLIYPKRLVSGAAQYLPALVIGAAILYVIAWDWPAAAVHLQLIIAIIMAVLVGAIAVQYVVNRRDPTARAILGWLGLSVILGAGGFVTTVVVPPLFGLPIVLEQSTAFLLFLIIYIGVALGVLRYRLFDLADWSVGVLFYAVGVALLLTLDALLIYGLALDQFPAFSLSLAVICLTYLPLRNRLSDRLNRGTILPMEELYRRVTDITHMPEGPAQHQRIRALWAELFQPLNISPVTDAEAADLSTATAPVLANDGQTLLLPRGAHFDALRLDFPAQGARLFSSRDAAQAATIGHLLDDSLGRHKAYRQAISTERSRINRDMHDNIGILLLSALHNPALDRKNALIRQTLSDLREIVANPMHDPLPLRDLIADLRAELGEALEAARIDLRWDGTDLPDITVPNQTFRLLRALLREGVSNILHHSGARQASVSVQVTQDQILVSLVDDGTGFDVTAAAAGNGLQNLHQRMVQSGSSFSISSSSSGTCLSARLPLYPSAKGAAP
ncbi:MAG: ATPase [Rhodobacteraceae bacterium]|jgi:signal transduction histidine kinase|nr:ATPase [Paracoccaceae bacterium]